MFHSTVFTPDYRLTRDALVRLVGMRVLEFTRAEVPAIGRAGGMSWIGDNSLELGQPLFEGSPQARWVEKFGGGNHSVAVQVEDMVAAVEHLRARDVRLIRASTGYPYHVMFSDPRDTGGVFIEWFQGSPEFDPRWGAKLPEEQLTPVVEVTQQAWVAAVVHDPLPLADRLADLLGTHVTFTRPDADAGEPVAGVSLGDCTLALHPMPAGDDESRRLWGVEHRAPRCSALGLRVTDLDRAVAAVEEYGIGIVRRTATTAVLAPSPTTGHAELVLTDRLLDGDPRLDPTDAARVA
jgi:hypothetical protein